LRILILIPFKAHGWSRRSQRTLRTVVMSIHLYVHAVEGQSSFMAQKLRNSGTGGIGAVISAVAS
jgi:hypothetical protein